MRRVTIEASVNECMCGEQGLHSVSPAKMNVPRVYVSYTDRLAHTPLSNGSSEIWRCKCAASSIIHVHYAVLHISTFDYVRVRRSTGGPKHGSSNDLEKQINWLI